MQLGTELTLWSWLSARIDSLGHYAWNNIIAGSQGRFDALLAAGSLQLCSGRALERQVRLLLCAGPAIGAVHARGHGYAPNLASTGLWLAIRSGLRLEARLGIPWVLDVEVISRVLAPSFNARRESAEALSRPSDPTGVVVSLGPAATF